MATKTLEVFLAVDADGDWYAGGEAETAVDNYNDNYSSQILRVVKINVTLTLPEVQEASVTIPDDAGQTVEASAS